MRHPDDGLSGDQVWTGAGHPDEGTIHAWLDDALTPGEAAALERHVAGCDACAAAVAEARGLIAASSQIVARLDRVPGGVVPVVESDPDVIPLAPRRRAAIPVWRRGSVSALAAVALVAVGVTAVLRETGSERTLSEVSAPPEAAASLGDSAPVAALADGVAAGVEARDAAGEPPAVAASEPGAARKAAPETAGVAPTTQPATGEGRRADGAVAERPPADAAAATAASAASASTTARDMAARSLATSESARAKVVPADSVSRLTLRTQRARAGSTGVAAGVASGVARGVSGGVAGGMAGMIARDSSTVVGRVVARGSGAPIPGAVVRLRGHAEGAVTDSAGRFRLTGVPAGGSVAQVRRSGFIPESVTVRAAAPPAGAELADAGAQVTITLRPDMLARAGTAAAPPPLSSAAPSAPPPPAVGRFAGCYRLSVGSAAGETRDRIEGVLPGWLLLDRTPRAAPGWYVAGSAAGEEPAGTNRARWRVSDALVSVEWPADDRILDLRLRPWAEGLAGTAAWRAVDEEGVEEEVSVLARRVACGG